MDDRDWHRLIAQLKNGDILPFVGGEATDGILPNGVDLSERWASAYGYPFVDRGDLPRVMQFVATTLGDPVHLKQQVSRELMTPPTPDFASDTEVHGLLARFPIPVFVTTNYDDFLTRALVRARKSPQVATCPWNFEYSYEPLDGPVQSVEGSPAAPLVYHLHGSLAEPDSMVLTEDDYLQFLVNMVLDRGGDDRRLLPPAVLFALATRPILFLGYSLRDWSFRVLFQGLLRNIPGIHRRRHVAVQVLPPLDDGAATGHAKDYLARYLDGWNISIYWGTTAQFCADLCERMEGGE